MSPAIVRLRAALTPDQLQILDYWVRRCGADRVYAALAMDRAEKDIRDAIVRAWRRRGMTIRRAAELLGCGTTTIELANKKPFEKRWTAAAEVARIRAERPFFLAFDTERARLAGVRQP